MPVPETTPRLLVVGDLELVRMRCRRCSGPWCRTSEASSNCPFCGHRDTVGALELLPKALPLEPRPPVLEPLDLFARLTHEREEGPWSSRP